MSQEELKRCEFTPLGGSEFASRALGFDERSTFARVASSEVVGEKGALSLTVPPFSVVRASVK